MPRNKKTSRDTETRSVDRGKLIVLEGMDEVGKSTIAQMLLERCSTLGLPSEVASFPGRATGTLGAHVYDLYHNPRRFGVTTVREKVMQLLATAAHVEVIESLVIPSLVSGKIVFLDRYWWSTWVYGRVAGLAEKELNQLVGVELLSWNGVVPSRLFLVTRKSAVDGSPSQEAVRRRLASAYLSLAKRERRTNRFPINVIRNDGPLEETLRELLLLCDLPLQQ